jgi:ribulose-bisphosphate carboxylase large chain
MAAMPVFSSGQTGLVAAATYAATAQSADLIVAAGGGIFGHPGGVAAGVGALRSAWDAAIEGVPLETRAQQDAVLKQAMGFW